MKEIVSNYEFTDAHAKAVPDRIFEYNSYLDGVPIIIDNGSYQSRVGWATTAEPVLLFNNCYAKHRRDRGKKMPATIELLVGNDINNIEAVRFQLKRAHDENVVTHFQGQQLLLDYTFSHLGLGNFTGIHHPIVMTEPFLNPQFSRARMSELLFECYNVPQVAYCVDGIASYYHNCNDSNSSLLLSDGLILHLGHHTTHVIPVLDGTADYARTRRIRVGGHTMSKFLCRSLQLKYPLQANNITLSRAEELIYKCVRIAKDFSEELDHYTNSECFESAATLCVQLPYAAAPGPVQQAEAAAAQKERRREAARRLVQINARRREEKLAEDESEQSRLLELREALTEFTPEQPEYAHALDEAGVSSCEQLNQKLSALEHKIRRAKAKLEATVNAADTEQTTRPPTPCPSRVTHYIPPNDPAAVGEWVTSLKTEWGDIQQRRNARRNKRQEMAKRRTAASQERMRIISQLAKREKKDDSFGKRDEDWEVYKAINKEGGGSDSEEETERLSELESLLRQHCPDFLTEEQQPLNPAQQNQLHLSTELIRTGEVLFQPSLIGVEQGGLAETVEYVLRLFTAEEQHRLVANVFVTGGPANLPGLVERLEMELMAMRPFKSHFSVRKAKFPSLDAWHGCQKVAGKLLETFGITKLQYEENGADWTPRHPLGNPYWKRTSPAPAEDTKLADVGAPSNEHDTS